MRTMKQFCKYGHDTFVTGRYASGNCKKCSIERAQKWNRENPERSKELSNRWNKKNPEKARERSQNWYINNPKKVKERGWKVAKIINQDGTPFKHIDFDRFFEIQQGCCAICGKHQSEFKRVLDVDHDHKTGIVRGLLCEICNKHLGIFESFKYKAQKYLHYEQTR